MLRKSHWIAMIGFVFLSIPAINAYAGSHEDDKEIINRFISSIEDSQQFEEQQLKRVVDMVKKMRDDEYDRIMAITEGLRELNPDFRVALEALGGEDVSPAITALSQLAKSDNPFLSSEASFYLAQAYSFTERYEDAIPILKDLIEKKADTSIQTGDATFLLGVSQARTLQRKEAIESLTKFLDENPNAPERMRIGAWRQCEQLKMLQEGTLADVFDRMDYSRRNLQLKNSGDPTQQQQDKIIDMLAKLIKEAEECECNGSGSGEQQGEGQDGQQGQGKGTPGGNSQNENGIVRRTYRNGPDSPWSKLRDRQRDPAFSASTEKFPPRYQQLIQQYYKSFQGEGN